jgi:hypothetical protein
MLIEIMTDSNNLYNQLLKQCSEEIHTFTKNAPTHESQFTFTDFNQKCVDVIYEGLGGKNIITPRLELFDPIPELEEACKGCYKYFMNRRNRFAKSLDIKLGKKFEVFFVDFLNSIGISSGLLEKKPLNYPDIVIKNGAGDIVSRCEIKYMAAPFLLLYKKVPGRECYEGSNTLDVGGKIAKQRNFVENEIDVPVFYIYWLDYPCVKGIYFISSEEVYEYIDSVGGIQFEREERAGDFVTTKEGEKKKLSQTSKVYLPLYKMKNFESLVDEFHRLIRN